MKIIAVVGTRSGCGKTTAACRILRAIPGLGAVKISPRDGAGRIEWGAGEPGKDTDLYGVNGAVKVARIIGSRDAVAPTWDRIKSQFEGCRGVIIEGASSLGIAGERYVVFVAGDTRDDPRNERNRAIAAISDAIIENSSHSIPESVLEALRMFLSRFAKP